jgi:hypothetical protein
MAWHFVTKSAIDIAPSIFNLFVFWNPKVATTQTMHANHGGTDHRSMRTSRMVAKSKVRSHAGCDQGSTWTSQVVVGRKIRRYKNEDRYLPIAVQVSPPFCPAIFCQPGAD